MFILSSARYRERGESSYDGGAEACCNILASFKVGERPLISCFLNVCQQHGHDILLLPVRPYAFIFDFKVQTASLSYCLVH